MIAILVGLGASAAITLAMVGDVLWDRRRARQANQAWFDAHCRPAGEAAESDVLS